VANQATIRRRLTAVVALLAAVATLLFAAPAAAAPDPEGGDKLLHDALERAARGHLDAKAKLDKSIKRQRELTKQLRDAQLEAQLLQTQVGAIAAKSYRIGRLGGLTLLLNSASPDAFLERAARLDEMAQIDGKALTRYRQAVSRATQAKQGIDLAIKQQQSQVVIMAKRKEKAARALAAVGIGGSGVGFVDANSPLAQPAPRNSDGSWPRESCTVKDPTTSGCITPRLLHAYRAAQGAGFTHYTACFSRRASGEHPKGRACDFSANASTFKNSAATGADKAYGDRLAAFLVKNASRLGVMYVIWYRQVWEPGRGWHRYSRSGPPNVVHTNHVHLSVL
jgi:hypothetical protein